MTPALQTRRQFVVAASAGAGALVVGPALAGCAPGSDLYAEAVRDVWRPSPAGFPGALAVQRELVRCATLAPSSHNTQCWRFDVAPGAITIRPDFTRRCPAVDPDDHHLWTSLGCAAENLAQAGRAYGLEPEIEVDSAAVRVALSPRPPERSVLFEAIPERQSTRGPYDGAALTGDELRRLSLAGHAPGVRLDLVTDPAQTERVLELVTEGAGAQVADPAFVAEILSWVRFNGRDAARTGDGLYSASSGNPTLPAWLGRALFKRVFTAESENDRYAAQVRSSAGIAVFNSTAPGPATWVAVGRAYERFALQATALGVQTSMLNPPIEVPALRPQLAELLDLGDGRPDLVVRFGRGPTLPRSLRRPLAAVIDGPPPA